VGLGSLVLAGVGALIASSTLWLAFKQVVTSKAQLHQSTLAAARETTAGMLRETGQGIGSRAWVTFQGTYRVGGAISTGGSVAISTVGTRASSLINETQRHLSEASVWTASVPSLAFPLPTLGSNSRTALSLFANPWSSPPDEEPITSTEIEEADQGICEQVAEGLNIGLTSDGRLLGFADGSGQIVATMEENFSSLSHQNLGELAEPVFIVATPSEIDADSDTSSYLTAEEFEDGLSESTIAWRNDQAN
jgi:hypothetical protein